MKLRPKHDPHCDCGICAYCNGQEDIWGNKKSDAAIKQAQPQEMELLPCPFCGGPAKFEDGGFNAIRVSCADHDCVQRQRVHKRDPKCHAKLIAHWNTRNGSASQTK